jgi:hypothetical protein
MVLLALAGLAVSLLVTFWWEGGDAGGRTLDAGDLFAVPPLQPQEDLGPVPELPPDEPSGLDVYSGAGAWVDQYDTEVLDNPFPALEEMRDRGVRTVYLETGSWRLPRARNFRDRQAMRLMIDQAHGLGMKVVAWYLPGLDQVRLDLRRTRAAFRLRSLQGEPFDGFAADIESQRVRSLPARNAALMRYSRALRRHAGEDYALGAIVPDQRSSTISPGLWPGLPYAALAPLYDVFLPMAYSTYRGRGADFVYRYTRANVEFVRAATRRPVHLIGGLDPLRAAEPGAVVRGARDGGAIGASFYDFVGATGATWRALANSP